MSAVVGIRGAIVCAENSKSAILSSTLELLKELIEANEITEDAVAGVFLTATRDLNAEFPAYAVREMGWRNVAALCAHEMDVPGAMGKVIRVMMFVNQEQPKPVNHRYLGAAQALRPDLAGDQE